MRFTLFDKALNNCFSSSNLLKQNDRVVGAEQHSRTGKGLLFWIPLELEVLRRVQFVKVSYLFENFIENKTIRGEIRARHERNCNPHRRRQRNGDYHILDSH